MNSEASARTSHQREFDTLFEADNRISHSDSFDNLIMRFEEPSSMVRWDSPLFTIPFDEDMPMEEIWTTITTGFKKPPTAAVAVVSRTRFPQFVQPLTSLSDPNLLLEPCKLSPLPQAPSHLPSSLM